MHPQEGPAGEDLIAPPSHRARSYRVEIWGLAGEDLIAPPSYRARSYRVEIWGLAGEDLIAPLSRSYRVEIMVGHFKVEFARLQCKACGSYVRAKGDLIGQTGQKFNVR